MDIFILVISIILLVVPITDWTAVYILRKIYKSTPEPSITLKERYFVAAVLAVVTTMNAVIAANAIETLATGVSLLPRGVPLTILAIGLVLISLPNIYWLWLYYTKRLR